MSLDLTLIAADVAARLGVPEVAALVSVTAAVDYIVRDTGYPVEDMTNDDLMLSQFGIPLLAMRMHQDSPTPGAISEFDPTYTGSRVPRNLYTHLDEYWRHLRQNFGIA